MHRTRTAAQRKALLASKLRAAGVGVAEQHGPPATIPERADPLHAPLSFAQRHAWLYQQARPDSVANNLCLLLTATGELDLDAVRGAFDAVVERHEVLRTTYHAGEDGEPYQYVHPSLPPRSRTVDLAGRAPQAQDEAVAELVAAAVAEPFDLAREGPLRLWFVRRSATSHQIVLVVQHIVWDGTTLAAISADLRDCYERLLRGERPDPTPPRPQYADFAAWEQAGWRERPTTAADHEYWTRRLRPAPEPLALPYRDGAPAEPGDRGAREDRRLSGVHPQQLRELASAHATTPFVVFLACYLDVLRRHSGSDGGANGTADAADIVLGTLAVEREAPGLARLAGNFSNPVALRFDLDGATDFAELVRRTRTGAETGFVHRGYPFLPLAAELAGHDGTGRVPFFDAMVVFVAQDIEGPNLPGVRMDWQRVDNGAAQFPLVPLGLEVFVRSAGIDVQFTYSTDMFERATVRALLDDLERDLRAATARAGEH